MDRHALLELPDENFLALCRVDCYRGTGPGGQHRNKTDSAVRLTLACPGREPLVVTVCDSRSQLGNKLSALRRLRLSVALHWREPGCQPWPSPAAPGHKDRRYPAFIANLLDALAATEWQVSTAATQVGLSTGRFVRLLADEEHAWDIANRARRERGLTPLRLP